MVTGCVCCAKLLASSKKARATSAWNAPAPREDGFSRWQQLSLSRENSKPFGMASRLCPLLVPIVEPNNLVAGQGQLSYVEGSSSSGVMIAQRL